MKINLECGNDVILGYKNLDMHPVHKLCEKGDFRNIGVADGSVEEIRVGQALAKIHMTEIPSVLHHWKNKLQVGGRIYLTGFDADLVSTAGAFNQVGLDELNKTLYGEPNATNRGIYSLATMEVFLQKNGFKIIEKGLNGNLFYIEGEKVS